MFPILFLPDKEGPTKGPLSNFLDTNISIHTSKRGVGLKLHHFTRTECTPHQSYTATVTWPVGHAGWA